MHPRIPLAFLAARAHCWLMVNLSSTSTPRSLSTELLSSRSAPSLYWCLGLFLPIKPPGSLWRFSLEWMYCITSCFTPRDPQPPPLRSHPWSTLKAGANASTQFLLTKSSFLYFFAPSKKFPFLNLTLSCQTVYWSLLIPCLPQSANKSQDRGYYFLCFPIPRRPPCVAACCSTSIQISPKAPALSQNWRETWQRPLQTRLFVVNSKLLTPKANSAAPEICLRHSWQYITSPSEINTASIMTNALSDWSLYVHVNKKAFWSTEGQFPSHQFVFASFLFFYSFISFALHA